MANIILGRRMLGRHILAGKGKSAVVIISYPLQESGYSVRIYNRNGEKLAEIGDHIQDNPILSIEFELLTTGCGEFTLTLGKQLEEVTLTYNHRIDISLFGDGNPWYSGYITKIPKPGTTEKTFVYEGYGFFNQLNDVIINDTYEDTEISQIVKNIMTTTIEPNTDVVYNASKIYSTDYTANKLKFSYVTAKEALSNLVDFAGDYVYGVDEYQQFFFKPVTTEINEDSRFWVGWHAHEFKPEESIDDLKNYVYIKASSTYVTKLATAISTTTETTITVKTSLKISAGDILEIDSERVYVSAVTGNSLTVSRGYDNTTAATHSSGAMVSNTSISTTTTRILYSCFDSASIDAYGLKQDILSIPSAMSEDDAQRWGDYQLSKLKDPTITATVDRILLKQKLIKAEGLARVTAEDGESVYELPIVKVNYSISSSDGISCGLSLGALSADDLDVYIATLMRNTRNNELLKQYESEE